MSVLGQTDCVIGRFGPQTGVVQTGPMQLSVDMFAISKHSDLKADIQIKGIYTTRVRIHLHFHVSSRFTKEFYMHCLLLLGSLCGYVKAVLI